MCPILADVGSAATAARKLHSWGQVYLAVWRNADPSGNMAPGASISQHYCASMISTFAPLVSDYSFNLLPTSVVVGTFWGLLCYEVGHYVPFIS